MPDRSMLLRPSSHPVVWGIDPSTRRIALATYDGRHATVQSLETRNDLAYLRAALIPWMAALHTPSFVFIEQPFAYGRPVPPVSYYVIGVVMEAVQTSLDVPANPIPVPDWKKRSVGFGSAKKPRILEWARHEHGYQGRCERCDLGMECRGSRAHDEADALGVAVAGWDMVGLELMAA